MHVCLAYLFFNSIIAERIVFYCLVNTRVELMTWTQWKTRFATIRSKWKTGLIHDLLTRTFYSLGWSDAFGKKEYSSCVVCMFSTYWICQLCCSIM